MPFTQATMFNLSAGSPAHYMYVTDDDVPTVSTTNYFDRRRVTLHVDDIISVISRAGGPAQITHMVVETATPTTVGVAVTTGAGVTGLTNPLVSDLAAAGNDLNDIGQVTLRDAGGGLLTLSNSPTGGLLVNGAPLATDTVAPDWQAATAYVANELAVEGGVLYRRNAAGTSAATFAADAANWTALGGAATADLLSDWAPATAYVLNQEVVEAGVLYRRTSAGISAGTFAADAGNWQQIGAAASAAIAPGFTPSNAYAANEIIAEGGAIYRRVAAGTSGATFAADAANWEKLSEPRTIVDDFAGGTAYVANEVVLDGGTLYRRNADGTSAATFALDAANWTAVTANAINVVDDWAGGTAYATNEVVLEGGLFYRRNAAGTSGATFDAAEAANWTQIGQGVNTAEDWAPTTAYVVNQVVVNGGLLYRSNSARTSGATFDAAEAAEWTLLSEPPHTLEDWSPSTSYVANQLVQQGGIIYRSNSTRTSGAAFDATEEAEWTALGSASPLTTAGDIYIRNATVDTRLPAPTENGKTLYSDSTVGEGLAWKGQVVSIADGGTLQPGFINRIADGATVTAPAAAGFADMNIGIMLAAGGTTATVNGAITAALTTPLQLQTYSSDGAAWNQYSSGASGSVSPLTTAGDLYAHDGTSDIRLPIGANGQELVPDSTLPESMKWRDKSTPAADATARDALTNLEADTFVIVADDDGNGNKQIYYVEAGGATFGAATTVPILESPEAPTTVNFDPPEIPVGGQQDTIIPFPGAAFGQAFVAAPPTDVGALGIDWQVGVSSAGNVRLTLTNESGLAQNLTAGIWSIYRVDQKVSTGVGGALNSLAVGAGLANTGTATDPIVSHDIPSLTAAGSVNLADSLIVDQGAGPVRASVTQLGAALPSGNVNTVAGVAPTAGDVPSSADAQNKIETGSDGGLAVFDLKRIALTGAGAVSLALATHRERLVELTDAATTSVNVATFAVGKTDGQAIDRAVIWNGTGAEITVAGGAGATAISDQAIALVQSVNGTALVTVLSGGIDLAAGADGSVIVQVAGADTRVQQEDAITAEFLTGIDGSGRSWIATYDGEIFQGRGLAGANSYDVNVTIDGAAVTPATITVNTTALATTAVTASRAFTKGQRVRMAFANAATATDGFFQLDIRRTGA